VHTSEKKEEGQEESKPNKQTNKQTNSTTCALNHKPSSTPTQAFAKNHPERLE